MNKNFKPKITLFHCINTFSDGASLPIAAEVDCELQSVKLPCSSMVKDVFLLRAFESGSDATVVFICPEGECRYVEGNIRAKKRVKRVKDLLDEIGLDGRRLSIFNISSGDEAAAVQNIQKAISDLADLGPNPAV
jgi:F420-non-reducing hydrogenase iron-sulfur subunit